MRRAPLAALLLPSLLAGCAARPPAPPAWVPPALVPFLGDFRGTMQAHGRAGVQPVPMRLAVGPLPGDEDRLRWVLTYGEGATEQVRDYRLVFVDVVAGDYRIDEQNGIELAARLCAGELVSVFLVTGQTLVVRYRAVADGIEFALEAFDPQRAVPTGEGVRSVASVAVQRAMLRRQTGS